MRMQTVVRFVSLALVLTLAGAGCAEYAAPTSAPEPAAAPRTMSNPGLGHLDLAKKIVSEAEAIWTTVATAIVRPEDLTVLEGSRYQLTFVPGSVSEEITVTIQERDPGIVDVELGPDGTAFEEPVVLTIDYAGTANDPRSEKYHRMPPQVFWWNPERECWVAMKGTDDPATLTYSVTLEHFSRYAMGDGTSGWEGPEGPGNAHPSEDVK